MRLAITLTLKILKRPPNYPLSETYHLLLVDLWGVPCPSERRDDHVVQSRDCRITIATQYQTMHQQIVTWNSYRETSLGECPFILKLESLPFGSPFRRWSYVTSTHTFESLCLVEHGQTQLAGATTAHPTQSLWRLRRSA